jgi:Wzt-like putative exopolysaccharide export protein
VADGAAGEVVEQYLARHAPRAPAIEFVERSGRAVEVTSVAITDEAGEPLEPRSNESFVVRARLHARELVPDLDAAIYMSDSDGVRVLNEAWHEQGGIGHSWTPPQELEASVTVPGVLAPGQYVVGVWIASSEECFFFEDVLTLTVRERASDLAASLEKRRIVRSPEGLSLRVL